MFEIIQLAREIDGNVEVQQGQRSIALVFSNSDNAVRFIQELENRNGIRFSATLNGGSNREVIVTVR